MTRTLHWFPELVSVGCFWLRRRSNYPTGCAQLGREEAGGPSRASGDTPDAEDFMPSSLSDLADHMTHRV